MKKIFTLFMLLVASLIVVSCTGGDEPTPSTDENIALALAVNNGKETIVYKQAEAYVGLDGVTYQNGMLKPMWKELETKLNLTLTDKASDQDTDSSPQFKRYLALQTPFEGVDMITGNTADFTEAGPKNLIVPLSDYLSEMPNLQKFLEDNPDVQKQMKASDGKMYNTPYVDSYKDTVSHFMMRLDWVRKLLDDSLPAVGVDTTTLSSSSFVATLPEVLNTKILVPSESGGTKEITKNYTQNIITKQNNLINKTGLELLKALRDHIDTTYGTQYAKRSDLFISSQAAYDADELVALMRAVKHNAKFLTGTFTADQITIFAPRSGKGTDHRLVKRLAQIWGVRGLEATFQWTWAEKDGTLHDARNEDELYAGFEKLHELYNEGLIQQDYDKGYNNDLNLEWRKELLTRGQLFMSYDIPSTSSGFATGDDKTGEYGSILPPAVKWNDGETDKEYEYFHFTESVNNVKTGGWGIPTRAWTSASQAKKDRMLAVIDYFYSQEGADLVNFGPEAWRDGTFTYPGDGKEYIKFDDRAIAEMQNQELRSKGNWSQYMRMYVGATMTIGHSRPSAVAYQQLSEQGKDSVARIGAALSAGTYKVATFDPVENQWYRAIPTLSVTPQQQEIMNQHQDLVVKTQYSSTIQPKWTLLIKNGWDHSVTRSEWGTKEEIATARVEFNTYWLGIYQIIYNNYNK